MRINKLLIVMFLSGLFMLPLFVLGVRSTQARGLFASISVTTTTDGLNDGDGQCSLREAIEAANTDTAVDSCGVGSGNDTITLIAGTYVLTHSGKDLDITSTLTIQGNGATIDGNTNDRVFDIAASKAVTISDVTITNGDASFGGGIRNKGTLVLNNSTVTGNKATNDGGGILNNGTATLNNTIVSENSTKAGVADDDDIGGGISNEAENTNATLTLNNSQVLSNTVNGTGGGGIANSADTNKTATLVLSQTIVSSNIATATQVISTTGFGGGIRNGFFSDSTSNAKATVTIENSTISNNQAINGGGIGSGTAGSSSTIEVTLNKSTVNKNSASGDGTLVGNGGGIINLNGTMSAVNSTVSGNAANGTGSASGQGDGIVNSGADVAATLWLTNTTVASNTAASGNGVTNLRLGSATTTNFKNSIIAGGCSNPDVSFGVGTFNSLGHNLEDGDTCNLTATGDIKNTNPLLGPLQKQNVSDDTATHELLSDSFAIDSGSCSGAPAADQRGESRPNSVSPFCDMGAYESNLLGVVDLAVNKTATPTQADPGQTITYTLTFSNNGPAGAIGVVITDIVPVTLTNLAKSNSGATITAANGITYSWTVTNLISGDSGIITITGQISSGLTGNGSFNNTAEISGSNSDNDSDNNNSSQSISFGSSNEIFLPIVLKDSE